MNKVYFLEFSIDEQTSITVNVYKILTVIENSNKKAIIALSRDETYTLNHTYAEAISMIQSCSSVIVRKRK